MVATLNQDITGTGINQGDLVLLLQNIVDLINELQTDHATFKTVVTDTKTAVNSVITAAATTVTAVSSSAPATLTNNTALTLLHG